MIKNDLKISDLEKYTFFFFLNDFDGFDKSNSHYSKNSLLSYETSFSKKIIQIK